MSDFEQRLGHTFQNKKLLQTAVSHSSYANEVRTRSNERLEFLGDSVLSLVVAQYLFHRYPKLPEGELTKLRASLVCEKALCGFAEELRLGEELLLGKGEETTGGRERPSILADAFEAVLAAIYLDAGFETAERFVLRFVKAHLQHADEDTKDYKTQLQEIVQQNREERVRYVLVSETGPDHDKEFCVEIHLNRNVIGTGKGHSKKEAEQMAAKEALGLMGEA